METQVIALAQPHARDRMVKRGARALFKTVRALTGHAKAAPGVMHDVLVDVRDAWQETAPKA